MGFVPPLNLGNFQPSPATLSQWIYQIWQYLQENPIATQEQLQEYIGTFITTSPETQTMIGEGVEQYLTENPPAVPVQSVQGKTGAVQLAYNEIVPASNAIPVYKASSTPSTNTLVGQYNIGYRLFVNTATQEIFTISPAGALSLVGRGKFDGTTVDLNSEEGDTTIAEALSTIGTSGTLLPNGSYSVDSGVLTLNDSYKNYDLIVVRVGFGVSEGQPGGMMFWTYPTSSVNVNNCISLLQFDGPNRKLYNFSLVFPSETTFKINSCFNITEGASAPTFNNIRGITGIKLQA